jgi:ATP-dependent Clp protease protease subunit
LAHIESAMERDKFLSPDEAKEFGLIDEVVSSRPADENDKSKDSKN